MRAASTARAGLLVIATCICLGMPLPTRAETPADYFQQNCSQCHTVGGGDLIGPDLEGVAKRKDRAWLVKFLLDPQAVIDSGDPYAARLLKESHGLVMPSSAGMTAELANVLLDSLEGKQTPAPSASPGALIGDRPFAPADIALGRQLFLGERRFAAGGPACVSCHTLGTIGGLGGGRLGPDLTRLYDRLGGRRGVGAWLAGPPTPVMQSLFRNHALGPDEILPLLAVIEDASQRGQPAGASAIPKFLLLGLTGMIAALAVLQLAWRGRFRAVRPLMVHPQIRGER
jgi:cytochrome c2